MEDDSAPVPKAKRVASNPECEGFFAQAKSDTSQLAIESYFSQFGEIKSTKLLFRRKQFKGCGFVEFKNASSLEKALKVKEHKVSCITILVHMLYTWINGILPFINLVSLSSVQQIAILY